ncbi:unnamed protein product [Penicillium salamii]|uniref:Nascent polypeptide-associated complex subunit beta n=1 Tax=Penicillium salamii TaxID=1612424 RepID=A0A9W4NK40_9EURO|nr:unnamed protein product [Penicillium salamii]CAG8188483.1 unnamed protein product [Penicillium salamii]CAG8371245.1 unnamed protein product [Penicillium salamii]CAG8376159.1 unnamed protein product [Penicillium salamii]CAG8378632.1 unnamed protein product [Penicillium salamii]
MWIGILGTYPHLHPEILVSFCRISQIAIAICIPGFRIRVAPTIKPLFRYTHILIIRSGKGTPRRKVKKVVRNSGADDKKLQAALKKLNVQPLQGIEEVNMFKEDGNVIHFANPRVHGAVPSNTFALYGNGEEKELTELVPNILNQLGPDSLASLRKLAESYQNMQKQQGDKKDDEEDDIPDLVEGENFESKE